MNYRFAGNQLRPGDCRHTLRWCILVTAAAALGCGGCDFSSLSPKSHYESVEPGEALPGGDTTNRRMLGANSFLRPADNLSQQNLSPFYGGNAFFNQAWVESPSSTTARDGLGPLFNAQSCSSCHFKDGKGVPPEDNVAPFEGLLFRLGLPGDNGVNAHPVYGSQLQDGSNQGIPTEGVAKINWTEIERTYGDGTPYTLMKPSYTLHDLNHGPVEEDIRLSPRIAPHMVGLGLLEAIPEERLQEFADPNDEDEDGISGEIQRDSSGLVGRFGWKGDKPTIDSQVAAALIGDMGLTSEIHMKDDCTETQTACLEAPNGGEPETTPEVFELLSHYSRAIAVPVRRNVDDPIVLQGKGLFHEIGCASCHVPSHVTGPAAIPELEEQLIWPYTDLLLHEMGEELGDNFPIGNASGTEWKTPPLWGLGLVEAVGGHTRYLHDGRARNLEEAILWHGGEAKASREQFEHLSADKRSALLTFVSDL